MKQLNHLVLAQHQLTRGSLQNETTSICDVTSLSLSLSLSFFCLSLLDFLILFPVLDLTRNVCNLLLLRGKTKRLFSALSRRPIFLFSCRTFIPTFLFLSFLQRIRLAAITVPFFCGLNPKRILCGYLFCQLALSRLKASACAPSIKNTIL